MHAYVVAHMSVTPAPQLQHNQAATTNLCSHIPCYTSCTCEVHCLVHAAPGVHAAPVVQAKPTHRVQLRQLQIVAQPLLLIRS